MFSTESVEGLVARAGRSEQWCPKRVSAFEQGGAVWKRASMHVGSEGGLLAARGVDTEPEPADVAAFSGVDGSVDGSVTDLAVPVLEPASAGAAHVSGNAVTDAGAPESTAGAEADAAGSADTADSASSLWWSGWLVAVAGVVGGVWLWRVGVGWVSWGVVAGVGVIAGVLVWLLVRSLGVV